MKFLTARMLRPMLAPEGGAGGTGGSEGGAGGTGSSGGTGSEGGKEKTFTQEELNAIAAREKRQGASSILKNLGFEKEEDAKAFIEKYRQEEDAKKDDLKKATEAVDAEKAAKEAAEKKAELLEKKFKVVAMGVAADKAEDIVVLATSKMVDNKSFDDALAEIKVAYPTLFEAVEDNKNKGTGGGGGNHPRKQSGKEDEKGSIGKRLAEQRKTSGSQTKKKSYFDK